MLDTWVDIYEAWTWIRDTDTTRYGRGDTTNF